MKRSILYNIFAIFAMFGATAMQDGASGPGESTGSRLRRVNSQMQLHVVDDFNAACRIGFAREDIYQAKIDKVLAKCKARLGHKEVIEDKHGNQQEVDIIDISCRSIMAYIDRIEDSILGKGGSLLSCHSLCRDIIDRTRASGDLAQTVFIDNDLECFHHMFSHSTLWINDQLSSTVESIFREGYNNFTLFQLCASILLVHGLNEIGGDVGFAKGSKFSVGLPYKLGAKAWSGEGEYYVFWPQHALLQGEYFAIIFTQKALEDKTIFAYELGEILTKILLILLYDINFEDHYTMFSLGACARLESKYFDFVELSFPALKSSQLIKSTAERLRNMMAQKKQLKKIRSCEDMLSLFDKRCIPADMHLSLMSAFGDLDKIFTDVKVCQSQGDVLAKYQALRSAYKGFYEAIVNTLLLLEKNMSSPNGKTEEIKKIGNIRASLKSPLKNILGAECLQNADLLDLGSTSFPDYINARFREFNDWMKKHSELSKECIDALIKCIYEIVKLQAVEEQVLINELRSHQASCCVIWDIRGLLLQGADDYLEKVEECCLQKANLSHEVSSYIKDVGQNFVYARSAILDRKIHNWRKDWSQMRRLRQTRVSSFLRRNDPVRMRNVDVTMAILPPNTGGSTKLNLDSASALPMHKLRAREMCGKKSKQMTLVIYQNLLK